MGQSIDFHFHLKKGKRKEVFIHLISTKRGKVAIEAKSEITVVHYLKNVTHELLSPSNSCILSHLMFSLSPWYIQSCSMKPAFGHMEGLAFFTQENALVNEISSEFIRKPITIAAALETPALQWTRTTPPCNKIKQNFIIHLRKIIKSIIHSYAI